jgi:Ca2+-binding RTX toxin-like protein
MERSTMDVISIAPELRRRSSLVGVVLAVLAVTAALAVAMRPASAVTTTPFGANLASAVVPTFTLGSDETWVNNASAFNATPAGHVVPQDGVITGWRVKLAGVGSQLFQLRVVRGNTSVFLGQVRNVGAADGVSATFPDSTPVQTGDRIGITNASGFVPRLIAADGGSLDRWFDPLGASETRAPDDTIAFQVLIQADLYTGVTCAGKVPTIEGTNGKDTLNGTAGDDVILAGNGKDKVKGHGGSDTICGGSGKDEIKAGDGADTVFGEQGKDTINGGPGADVCNGGLGKDSFKNCETAIQ